MTHPRVRNLLSIKEILFSRHIKGLDFFFRYGFAGSAQEEPFKKGGELDIAILRKRENKWLHMLDHWDKYMMTRFKKVRQRCRKGIPSSIRPRAWQHLCGAKYRMTKHPGAFNRYLSEPGEEKWIDDIKKDLHRNFPNHELFGGTYERIGQSELFKVLKAYTVYNPNEGYCQAQAPIGNLFISSTFNQI